MFPKEKKLDSVSQLNTEMHISALSSALLIQQQQFVYLPHTWDSTLIRYQLGSWFGTHPFAGELNGQ